MTGASRMASGESVVASGVDRTSSPLLSLLHLCDSLFPLGGFAHSDGLEAATASGRITGRDGLRSWMDACLDDNLGRFEGPAVILAWRVFAMGSAPVVGSPPVVESAFRRTSECRSTTSMAPTGVATLLELDAEVHALRPSSAARQASRAMGTRLLKTWQQIHQTRDVDDLSEFLDHVAKSGARARPDVAQGFSPAMSMDVAQAFSPAVPVQLTLPVAFGVVCASAGIEERTTLEAFIYTRLASTVSCAMRVMSIGQHEAHALLASLLTRVPAVAGGILARGDPPAAFMPAMDLAAMSHQYVHSRLFRS
jgi:urease accessory protein